MDKRELAERSYQSELSKRPEAEDGLLLSYPVVVLLLYVFFFFFTRDIVHPFISEIISK